MFRSELVNLGTEESQLVLFGRTSAMTEHVNGVNSKSSCASYYRARYYDPTAGRLARAAPYSCKLAKRFRRDHTSCAGHTWAV